MKNVIVTSLAAIALGSMLATPAFADRVIRMNETGPGNLDPYMAADKAATLLMINVYDTLLSFAPGGELEPHLATGWAVSDNGLEYTFKLKPSVAFASGNPVTADDVVYSFNRLMALKRGFSFLFERVKEVRAPDQGTVVFVLAEPYAPFLSNLANFAIIDAKVARAHQAAGDFGENGDYAQAYLSANSAGSGPYKSTRHDPREGTTLEMNASYSGTFAQNAPQTVRIRYGIDAATVRTLFSRGELDISRIPLTTEVLTGLASMDGVKLTTDKSLSLFTYKLNTTRPPTDDLAFRTAISLAFDYAAMGQLLSVGDIRLGYPASGPLPHGVLGYDPERKVAARDLDAAKAALAKSKYKPGDYTLDLLRIPEAPQQEKYSLLFQQNMSELGINVNIITAPWAQLQQLAQTAQATPHVSSVYVGLQTPDPDSLFWPEYHSTAAGTFTSMEWYHTPELDAKLEQGRRLTSVPERQAFYKQLSDEVIAQHTALYVYERAGAVVLRSAVTAPSLEDPNAAVPLLSGNFQFRSMSVADK